MAKIGFHRHAQKYLKRMDSRIKAQLLEKLEKLAEDPENAPNVKAMEGEYEGLHRMRHGDLRVIYKWDKPQDTILILTIGPRGDVYK
jgi:mRNA interferase RelE/StbE